MKVEQEININEEYERLFGSAQRIDLFAPEEDYYHGLRQEIINAPSSKLPSRKTPFVGIELIPYPRYAIEDLSQKFVEQGCMPFYIRESYYGKTDYCSAVGYYKWSGIFVLTKYSYIRNRRAPFDDIDKTFLEKDGIYWFMKSKRQFKSAKAAASFVLGRHALGSEWLNEQGRTFYECNPGLVEDATPEENLFYISEGNIKASGYFDQVSNLFYVKTGSRVAASIQRGFSSNNYYSPRLRFLRSICTFEGDHYRVSSDACCRSANAAACYVLGRPASYMEWKDEYGNRLTDYYPGQFKGIVTE